MQRDRIRLCCFKACLHFILFHEGERRQALEVLCANVSEKRL